MFKNPVHTPSNPEDHGLPPSYEHLYPQQQQSVRPQQQQQQHESLYPQQQVSQITLVVIPSQGGGFQTVSVVNNVANYNGGEAFRQSERNSYCAAVGTHRIFSDIIKRQVFVRNVYGIVSAQLLAIIVLMSVFVLYPTLWKHMEPGLSMALLVFFTLPIFVIIACCACYCSMPKRWPGNIACLVLHTLALGFFFAVVSAVAKDNTILVGVVITAIVCVSLTIFAVNFATCGGILVVVGIVLATFPLLLLLLRNVFPILNLIYACVGALIFSTFLVFDTQLIVMGKHRQSALISWNDCVFAVHTFHVDIMVIWFCRCPQRCC